MAYSYRHTVTPPVNQNFVGAFYHCMRGSNLEDFDWKTKKWNLIILHLYLSQGE